MNERLGKNFGATSSVTQKLRTGRRPKEAKKSNEYYEHKIVAISQQYLSHGHSSILDMFSPAIPLITHVEFRMWQGTAHVLLAYCNSQYLYRSHG